MTYLLLKRQIYNKFANITTEKPDNRNEKKSVGHLMKKNGAKWQERDDFQ